MAYRSATSADKPPEPDNPKKLEVAKPDALGGNKRYLTQASTDKPIYRPGEKVYLRGVLLEAHKHTPLPADQNLMAQVTIKGPKGDTVASGMTNSQDSVVGFSWPVPEGQAGGEYTAEISYPWTGQPAAERKFEIRAYRAPRLKSQIEFIRDGYGPGDSVAASLKVERAEGGFPQGAKVTIRARVDGQEVFQGASVVDLLGLCSARFELPKEIARGEGTLSFAVEDGGVVETAAKTIPILLQTVDLTTYPEGGELIAGLPNRVYLSAFTPAQKPADLAGEILDGDGKQVATFRTEHEGRGRFTFTPKAGQKYILKITEPSGIKTTYPLAEVKPQGAVLSSVNETTKVDAPVSLMVGSTTSGKLKVTLRQRETEVAAKTVDVAAEKLVRVEMTAPATAEGVLTATLWDEQGQPLAERLVFRQPAQSLTISITPDRERYVPGGQAKLTIKTTDAQGKPVSAVVGVTVTDDSVLEMIEKREQAPRLPVMVFLESEVKDLADAHVYLDPQNPEAPLAVDLLLGTQGWRRFAFLKPTEFLAEYGNDARNVLALTMSTQRERKRMLFFSDGAVDRFGGAPAPPQAAAQAAPVAEGIPEEAAPQNEPAEVPIDQQKEVADKQAAQQAPQQRGAEPAPGPNAAKKLGLERALEQGLAKQEAKDALLDQAAGARFRREAVNLVVVREFAHQLREGRQPGERSDFTETLYWNAGIKTDAKTGEASIAFALNDSVTSFRVLADAFDPKGSLGEGTAMIESVEPFYVEPKLPLEVTANDVIQLPLGLVNSTTDPLSNAMVSVNVKDLAQAEIAGFDLAPEARLRKLLTLKIGNKPGAIDVILKATAGPFADQVTRKLNVKPLGFPIEIAHGGTLDRDDVRKHKIVIPKTIIDGSLTTNVSVFPTPMASMTEALERLIQEPSGCFEQTSSTTYPLVMAQQYFQSHAGIDPDLIKRSNEALEKGYQRLTGYECKSHGYEWFGEDPGHEALTAYGLMEFRDMAEVFPVDTAMLARTREWLLKQRDGQGGFNRARRALHTWVVDADVSNAYITWALLSAGEKNLASEVSTVRQAAAKSQNSYVLALAANVMVLAGENVAANELMDRLRKLQQVDGQISGATGSIVGSGGEALIIETTALATLAWASDLEYVDFADKGIRYLSDVCKGGRFGSTQSTVLALKAIVAYDKAQAHPKAKGQLQLLVDGQSIGEPVPFDTDTKGAIELPAFPELLKAGEHEIAVQMIGGSRMPYAVAVKLHSEKPASSEECQLELKVALSEKTLQEGAVTEAQVTCKNTADKTVPTPVAIIGIPGGLEVRHDQLKELVKSKKIAAYEVLGREVVLYWRELKAGEQVELPINLVAAVPGQYTGPASRTYLYYTDEFKQWVDPLAVVVEPIAER